MISISICDTSDLVFPYNCYGNTGRVHSIFSSSFNLIVGKDLIHVSGTADFLSSFGIGIRLTDMKSVTDRIRVGDLVVLKEKDIILYSLSGVIRLSGQDSQIHQMSIIPVEYIKEDVEFLIRRLKAFSEEEPIGLEASIGFENVKDLLTTNPLSPEELGQALEFLIGRGLGLTPSGDDILLGYAFGLTVWTQIPILQDLRRYKEWMEHKTTDVSFAYLSALLRHRVSSPIYCLNQSLLLRSNGRIEKDFYRIREIGHTSGNDFLFGLYLSLQQIHVYNETGGSS